MKLHELIIVALGLITLVKPDIAKQNKQLKREFMQESDGKVYTTTKKRLKEVMKYK
jgi:hypothetical protein